MKFLFFDTETTGLPLNWKAPMTDLNNWPRVIQLAWIVRDLEGTIHSENSFLIKPNGWTIPDGEFWKTHGFSQEKSEAEGEELQWVLPRFIKDLLEVDGLVSHNMSFDHNVLGAEFIRYGASGRKVAKYCTKLLSTDYCMIPGKFNSFKWPKLEELHQFLFKKDFDNAHDALGDVFACSDCFLELVNRGVITLPGLPVVGGLSAPPSDMVEGFIKDLTDKNHLVP